MLTAAVGAGKQTVENGYEVAKIADILDYIGLMSYDLHGAWEDKTGFNSPLYKRASESGKAATLNAEWAVNDWLVKGCPKEKLIMGLATYGRSFTLEDPNQTGVGAPAKGAGDKGEYTGVEGFLSYYEVCTRIGQGWTDVYDEEQVANYIYKGNQWVGYDSIESLEIKTQYLMQMGLGGAMVWTYDLDDFSGTVCGQGPYPLMNTIKDIMAKGITRPTLKKIIPTNVPINQLTDSNIVDDNNDATTTKEPITTSTTTTTTTTTTTSTTTPALASSTLESTSTATLCQTGGIFAHPDTCSKFISCQYIGTAHAKEIVHECPDGLLFNPTALSCDWPYNVDC